MKSKNELMPGDVVLTGAFALACRDAAAYFTLALAAYAALLAYLASPWSTGGRISPVVVHGSMLAFATLAAAHWWRVRMTPADVGRALLADIAVRLRRWSGLRPVAVVKPLTVSAVFAFALARQSTVTDLIMLGFAIFIILSPRGRASTAFRLGLIALAVSGLGSFLESQVLILGAAILALEFLAIGTVRSVVDLRQENVKLSTFSG